MDIEQITNFCRLVSIKNLVRNGEKYSVVMICTTKAHTKKNKQGCSFSG